MLGNIFDNNDDLNQATCLLSKNDRKGNNCAYNLDLPPQNRDVSNLVGIRNQGATCYLNSLFQVLYMQPEFRSIILNLPLCEETLDQPSQFVQPSKQKILLAIQKLFAEMQNLNTRSVSTEDVTKSFGWDNNQEYQQQDIQEAQRVLHDVIGRALVGTNFQHQLEENYQGIQVGVLHCLNCQFNKEKEEIFYDILLQVKDFTCLKESLFSYIQPETLDGSNQVFCENCQSKQDTQKGVKIRKFPNILTFSLNRFEFDFEKMDRVKINSQFSFELEFNSLDFQEKVQNIEDQDSNEYKYELQAVLIHSGHAHGGHYHTYIRDTQNEGQWQLLMNQVVMTQENEKENDKKIEIEIEAEPKKQENQGDKSEKNKKQKKNNKNQSKKKEKEKKDNKKQEQDDAYDNQKFPILFENTSLNENWFDFNDSIVKAIPVGRLQKQFGGSSENAYILVYRKKTLNNQQILPIKLPKYLQNYINYQNGLLQAERDLYEKAKRQIEIFLIRTDDIDTNNLVYQNKDFDPETQSQKIILSLDNSVREQFNHIHEQFASRHNIDDLILVNVEEVSNQKLLWFRQKLDIRSEFIDQNMEQANQIRHKQCWLLFDLKNLNEKDQFIIDLVGEEKIPINVGLRKGQLNFNLILHQHNTLDQFKNKIEQLLQIPIEHQELKLIQEEKLIYICDSDNNQKNLKELNINDGSDIIVGHLQDNQSEQDDKSENSKKEGEGIFKPVIIETDDVLGTGTEKYFMDFEWTLEQLKKYIISKLNLDSNQKWRIRNLQDNSLFTDEEYNEQLQDLNLKSSKIRLRIEKGDIPSSGNILIKVRCESKHYQQPKFLQELIINPNSLIRQILQQVCVNLNLNPDLHKLYKSDWMGELETIDKYEKSLKINGIKNDDILVIRDNESPISSELIFFQLYQTQSGRPEDTEFLETIKIKENSTLLDLKNHILKMPRFKILELQSPNFLRVIEMRKDMFFNQILKQNDKLVKKLIKGKKSTPLAVQVLQSEENLAQEDILLFLRKRNVETRTYGEYKEIVLQGLSNRGPTIAELKQSVLLNIELNDLSINEIELAKFVNHEYFWHHISYEEIEREQNKKKQNKKKGKKGKKANKSQDQETEDLKKSPYLIRDGDIIGYKFIIEDQENKDDYQTFEDEQMRIKALEMRSNKFTYDKNGTKSKRQEGGGFQIITDF